MKICEKQYLFYPLCIDKTNVTQGVFQKKDTPDEKKSEKQAVHVQYFYVFVSTVNSLLYHGPLSH